MIWIRARGPGRAASLGAAAAAFALGAGTRPAAAQQPDSAARAASLGAAAPGRPVSLDDALRLAAAHSEAVQVARAGLTRAEGQRAVARSQYYPQINAVASYARTLRSQFQALASAPRDTSAVAQLRAVCAPYIPPTATAAERQAALDQAATCVQSGGIDFSSVGFGAKNQYTFGLSFAQNLFAGGRIAGQNQAASAGYDAAQTEVHAQRAQLALDVTQAYYDAVLADRLTTIAEAALQQTEEVLRQTRVARQVGNQAEFDLLRAQVTRDNQLPVVLQSRSMRQVAYYRLKQLLNLPLDDAVALTTPLDDSAAVRGTVTAAVNAGGSRPAAQQPRGDVVVADTATDERAPVRESAANVRAQEGLLKVARGERLPSLQLTSNYQRLYFPQDLLPQLNAARENWTIGVSASMPLFTGGRIRGDELVARGNLDEARARLQQTRELAALDARVALSALEEAEATWTASAGTAEQASRAYSIDQIRYREGISTQTDLSQSRLLLAQALANRAQAARNVAVARVKLSLLHDLPLQLNAASAQTQAGTPGANGTTGTMQGQSGAGSTTQTTRSATTSAASTSAIPGGGAQP